MTITIYTTNTCAYCKMVKKFFDSKGLAYNVVNLDDDPGLRQGLFERTGAMTVPITVIERGTLEFNEPKEWTIIGWKPAELAKAIA